MENIYICCTTYGEDGVVTSRMCRWGTIHEPTPHDDDQQVECDFCDGHEPIPHDYYYECNCDEQSDSCLYCEY